MTTRINLLPAEFAKLRRIRHRRRVWGLAWMLVAGAQACAAVYVHSLAQESRTQVNRAGLLGQALREEESACDATRAKVAAVTRDLNLAQRLQEKHLWSRWLGALSLVVPSQVVLTGVRTERARGQTASGLAPPPVTGAPGIGGPSAESVGTIVLSGAAAQHADLMALLKALNQEMWFRTVRLEEAKREKVGEAERIRFTLACEW